MDLSTSYMGMELRNPLIASASPLSRTVEGVRSLAAAGVGAVVLYSLFEEEIELEVAEQNRLLDSSVDRFGEALSYFPRSAVAVEPGPRRYLSVLERAANSVEVPIIASLNGTVAGSWERYACALQDAGARAIELNIYFVPNSTGRDAEQRYLDVVASVKAAVDVPVAVKLGVHFSSIPEMAKRLEDVGADALVVFNRVPLPDISVEDLSVDRVVELSDPREGRMARFWLALLHSHVHTSLAGTTGVETWEDVVKYLLVGADVVCTASALLRHQPAYATTMLSGLNDWMQRKGFEGLDRVRGLLASPDQQLIESERSAYFKAQWSANLADAWRPRIP